MWCSGCWRDEQWRLTCCCAVQIVELSPIENAIEEVNSKIGELEDAVERQPTDFKLLQLRLQGIVSAQVRAGGQAGWRSSR